MRSGKIGRLRAYFSAVLFLYRPRERVRTSGGEGGSIKFDEPKVRSTHERNQHKFAASSTPYGAPRSLTIDSIRHAQFQYVTSCSRSLLLLGRSEFYDRRYARRFTGIKIPERKSEGRRDREGGRSECPEHV